LAFEALIAPSIIEPVGISAYNIAPKTYRFVASKQRPLLGRVQELCPQSSPALRRIHNQTSNFDIWICLEPVCAEDVYPGDYYTFDLPNKNFVVVSLPYERDPSLRLLGGARVPQLSRQMCQSLGI